MSFEGYTGAGTNFSESVSPRSLTVFISCPGDLADHKKAAVSVVHEVNSLFSTHGIQIKSWVHEIDGVPSTAGDGQAVVNAQLPREYDIYIGLMCRRLGTPTPRAPSGTVEEFMLAQQRFLETGKPDILFYFCDFPSAPETEADRLQLEKVRHFRKAYPGLFATFHSEDQLKALVKHHLIDLLLNKSRRTTLRNRRWAQWLAQHLDSASGTGPYLDRSSSYVVRSLGKLEALINLPGVLSDREYETILAAQYIRALRCWGDDIDKTFTKLRDAHTATFNRAEAILTADLAEANYESLAATHELEGVRCGFLAALLRLGDALILDRSAIMACDGSISPPGENSPLADWMAYLTRRVEVTRGGGVTFYLAIPRSQAVHAASIRRSFAMVFEALWLQLRPVLAIHGVAIARTPMQSVPSSEVIPIPDSVLGALDQTTTQAESAIHELHHLGSVQQRSVPMEDIYPLPRSAIAGPLRFATHTDQSFSLFVCKQGEDNGSTLVSETTGEIVLDPAVLTSPGILYRWSLRRCDGDFSTEAATGLVWRITLDDQIRLAAAKASPNFHATLFRLGLHNDLIGALWPRLMAGRARIDECACVYDALLANYDWLRKNAPESSQIEAIRNSANLVRNMMLDNKGDVR